MKKRVFICFSLALSLVLVCLPRFNRRDIGFIDHLTSEGQKSHLHLADAGEYIKYVNYFRKNQIKGNLTPHATYRPFVPFIASFLPFGPMTSINIVNICFLLIALLFLNLTLYSFQFNLIHRVIGSILFIFSFPLFFYGAIGYIDPVVIGFLSIGVYFLSQKKWLICSILFMLGALVKESVVILVPVAFVSLFYCSYSWKKKVWLSIILSLSFLIPYQLIRIVNPISEAHFWWPTYAFFLLNVTRLKNWAGFLLGYGLPGFLSLGIIPFFQSLWPEKKDQLAPLIAGFLLAVCLYLYSLVAAYADARFIWTSYPFSIPLAVFVLDKKFPQLRAINLEK